VIKPSDDHCSIQVSGRLELNQKEFADITDCLSRPKTAEMEYYYDDLLLSGHEDNELSLLGLMIDDAEVEYQDGILSICVMRTF
jgi:hypothetical protein